MYLTTDAGTKTYYDKRTIQMSLILTWSNMYFHILPPQSLVWLKEDVEKWSFQWRFNEGDGASNHQCLACLLNRLFRRRSKKTSTFHVIGLCEGNPSVIGDQWIGDPHKGQVTRKMLPFDDVIMVSGNRLALTATFSQL